MRKKYLTTNQECLFPTTRICLRRQAGGPLCCRIVQFIEKMASFDRGTDP
jgi:catalase